MQVQPELQLQNCSLTQLVLKPTVFCYHRCPYCDLRQDYYQELLVSAKKTNNLIRNNGSARTHKAGHIPLDLSLRLIDEAAALGMKSLQLSGGDPLLYPHLVDLIRAGVRHPGVFVFMNSVGAGITLKRAEEIIEAGLGAWNFSVDSLDNATYDKLRGMRGALLEVLKAVEIVRKAARNHTEFCINYMTVITRDNFRHIPALIEHCLENGVSAVYLMNVYGDMNREALLTKLEIEEFRQEVIPAILAILKDKNTPNIVQTNAATVMRSFFSDDNSDSNYAQGIYWPSLDAVRRACNVPNYYALIEPDGRVLPCCLIEISHEAEVGSVVNGSLEDVWIGSAYREFRRHRVPFCQKCSAPRHRTLGLIPKMCRQFND